MRARDEEGWEARSACFPLRKEDPDLWESFYGDTTAERKPAKDVCAGCPVRLECLTAALDNAETWGVWGGCDEVDLRRALWLDTNGSERERRRFPRCPACRARTENLFVRSVCPLGGDVDVVRSVECGACTFSWSAATSVAAVTLFWAERRAADVVVPIRRPARVTVPRGRIPSGAPTRARKPVQLPAAQGSPDRAVQPLVASSGPPGRG
jgi:hypothetical protein